MSAAEYLSNGGTIPVHFNFLWNGFVHVWDPGSGVVLLRKIRDPQLAEACREYLASDNASFESMDRLREWAAAHAWPNAEDLPDLGESG